MMKKPMHSTAFLRFAGLSLVILCLSPSAPGQQPVTDGPVPGTVRINATDEQEYVWIPAGTFEMGCVPDDITCDEDEQPRHTVTLSRGFWMGRTEVTVGAYERFATAGGQPMPDAPDFNPAWRLKDHPIVRVEWGHAQSYCAWAGGGLPTEAQYEYAGRGGVDGAKYPWGDTASHDYANYEGVEGADQWPHTAPGGKFPPSKFGVHDLAGNVWEWTADWYREWYYARSQEIDPQGPEHGVEKVLRGGSWFNTPRVLRISDRFKYVVRAQDNSLGFRCVCVTLP